MVLEIIGGSSGPFLITLRESLEAALIIGIIAAYLGKTGKGELKKYLYVGTGAAILASIGIAGGLALLYGELPEIGEQLFGGTASILATGILTYMIFWMAKHAKEIKEHIQKKIDLAVSKGYVAGIGILAFVAVFREGIETVLFLTALGVKDFSSTIIGATIGIVLVIGLTFLVMKRIYSLNLQKLFKYSSILLVIFAAGLFGSGVHEYIEASQGAGVELGIVSASAYNINPPEGNAFNENGSVGGFFRGLVGYDGNPEWGRVIAYLGYWAVIGGFVYRTYGKAKKGDPSQTSLVRT